MCYLLSDMFDFILCLKAIQGCIVSQRDEAELVLDNMESILKHIEDVKMTLYFDVCSKCKDKVKKILGIKLLGENSDTHKKLPPESRKILQEMTNLLLKMERMKSGEDDTENLQSLTVTFLEEETSQMNVILPDMAENRENVIADMESDYQNMQLHIKTLSEYIQSLKMERDEALMNKTIYENELKEANVELKMTKENALDNVMKNRTLDGVKLAQENASLHETVEYLKSKFESKEKAYAHLQDTTVRQIQEYKDTLCRLEGETARRSCSTDKITMETKALTYSDTSAADAILTPTDAVVVEEWQRTLEDTSIHTTQRGVESGTMPLMADLSQPDIDITQSDHSTYHGY